MAERREDGVSDMAVEYLVTYIVETPNGWGWGDASVKTNVPLRLQDLEGVRDKLLSNARVTHSQARKIVFISLIRL